MSTSVSRYDYAQQLPNIDGLVKQLRAILLNGDYVLGQPVTDFEESFAEYIGCRYAVGVNSGTDAIYLALRALDIGPGDEVVTVANTFHATVLAITQTGARPVLTDCSSTDFLMDAQSVEMAITSRTKAVLPVHLFGNPVAMDAIRAVADRHNVPIVEDAAQAVGATYRGVKVGSLGTIGCFSFHPSKNLAAAGDAGAIVTNDERIRDRVRVLRGLGQSGQNNHTSRGVNSKLDSIQAAVLLSKLPFIDAWNDERRVLAHYYTQALTSTGVQVPDGKPGHAYHLFPVLTERRDQVVSALNKAGVEAVVRYPTPIHRQPAFRSLTLASNDAEFPHAVSQATHSFCLPIRPGLTTKQLDYVCETLSDILATE